MLKAVPSDFVPLLAALAAAALIYVLRERHRQRTTVNPARPDLRLDEVWELWPAHSSASETVRQQARQMLAEPENFMELRREILANATTALYLESILELREPERAVLLKGYQPGMEPLLRDAAAAHTVRWQVLREYGRLKYDDTVPDDWFHQFLEIARPYIREKVRLSRAFLVEMEQGAARLVEIYDELLRELSERMLKSPRKKRFPPPDLSRAGRVPSESHW